MGRRQGLCSGSRDLCRRAVKHRHCCLGRITHRLCVLTLLQVYDKDSLDHTVKLVNKSKSAESLTFEPSIIYAPKSNPRGVLKLGQKRDSMRACQQLICRAATDRADIALCFVQAW